MKSVSLLLACGLIALAQAQKECLSVAAKVPTCAASCLVTASGEVGCGAQDFRCSCSPDKAAAIGEKALPCIILSCGAAVGLTVQSTADAVCACAAAAAPDVPTSEKPTTSPAASSNPPVTSKPATSSAPNANPKSEVVTSSIHTARSTAAHPFSTTTATGFKLSGIPSSGIVPSSAAGSSSKPAILPSGSSAPFTGSAAERVGPTAAFIGVLLAAMFVF